MDLVEHAASRAQRRLWFVEQLAPGEPLHNIAFTLEYPDGLDPAALRAAAADVVERHEALRTRLAYRSGTLRQVVVDRPEGELVRFLDGVDDPTGAVVAAAARPFDLERAPLVRILQLRAAAGGDTLAVVIHHVVSDAWSINLMLGDLFRAYRARLAGREPGWDPLPVQYVDFTAWQEQQAGGEQARADLAYWRDQLAELSTLDLTLGRPRPRSVSHRGGSIPVEVRGEAYERLAALAAAERCTPFMVLLAGYVAALSRVFGTDDVAVGASVAGRPLPELTEVVGLFVDRQVLRLPVTGAETFRELLHRARDTVVAATEHGGVTFDQIVDALAPDREYGITPLAQAAINLQPGLAAAGLNRRTAVASATSVPANGGRVDTGYVQHDLGLDLVDLEPGYRGSVCFRAGVVAPETAGRVADLFHRVLATGLSTPDTPLWTVPAVPVAEADRLVALGDGGPAAGPGTPLVGLLDRWADRTPDAVAVRDGDRTLSYAALRARVDELAHRLVAAGVTTETPVLVATGRRAELVVAGYAVQRAGGAYVPVDPGAPAGHLAEVLAALRPAGDVLALARPGDDVALPAGVTRLAVDAGGPDPADPGPPAATLRPDQAAYVLFTSGSTGRPKGVVVEHRHLAGYAYGMAERLAPPPGGRYLMVQAPTFDSTGTMLYGALVSGGELDLAGPEVARDRAALAAHLAAHPADYLKITPSHLAALLGDDDPEPLRPRRALVLGGESCPAELTDRLRGAGWSVVAHYGPTETTIGVTASPLTGALGAGLATVPLGRPLPGVVLRVLDRQGQLVPFGTVGELHVSGALVTRGYLGEPGRTAAGYGPVDGGGRWYRTGDLVRPLPGGGYEFCGRIDRQVKVNGYRIEPAAVESAVRRHPAVRAVAVLARPGPGGTRLVAYVVADGSAGDGSPDPEAIRATAAGTLPRHAVPARVVLLAELPVTPHGKLDTAALPAPDEPAGTGTAPAGAAERELLDVWRHVLERDDLGVTDDFFAAGGDSIRAIAVVGEARRRGLGISSRDLFAAPTVRALAATLPADGADLAGAALPGDGTAATLPAEGAVGETAAGVAGDREASGGVPEDGGTADATAADDDAAGAGAGGYRSADFPDAGLDDAGLARVLGSLGIGGSR